MYIYYPDVVVFRLYMYAWQDDIDVWHNDTDIMTWQDGIWICIREMFRYTMQLRNEMDNKNDDEMSYEWAKTKMN